MKKILCFGDSNTWGHNPVDCSKLEKPWTVWLKDIVPEYEIVSDGVCGRATTHYLENEDKTNGLKDFRERYLSGENDFDLIIIMLGTNDVLNNIDFSNQKTADVLKIYVEECRAKFGKDKPKILLVSPILINDNCLTHPIFKDLYSEKSIEKSMHFSEYISKLADEEDTPTLIFDEIDSGISGITAGRVGERLQLIGKSRQVICITHLSQIAAAADIHFCIHKEAEDNSVRTQIERLDQEDSVAELARLLGGANVTDGIIDSAREMKELAKREK